MVYLKIITMEFKLKSFGGSGSVPAKIIELTINGWSSSITESITDLKGLVDYDMIQSLKDIIDELEEHNQKVSNQTNF